MNRTPLWKYLLILAIVVVGVVYALPNLFGEDPSLQVSPPRTATLDAAARERIMDSLQQANLTPRAVDEVERGILVRFEETEDQLRANDIVRAALGPEYTVALNLAPNTPDWLSALRAAPMYLGLDLRGGVHFLLEVDMEAAVHQALERYVNTFRSMLRDQRIRYLSVAREGGAVEIGFRDAAERERAQRHLGGEFRALEFTTAERGENFFLYARLSEDEQREIQRFAVQQNITTLRNRVNELGVAEPIIQQQGESRIVVQLPGVQDTARAKEILGTTATLEFRLAVGTHDQWQEAAQTGRVPFDARLYRERDGSPVLLSRQVIVTGDQITDASSGFDQEGGRPAVFVSLDGQGARAMSQTTRDNIGRPMAVVFIENRVETVMVGGEAQQRTRRVEEVISVATIQGHFSRRFQITGVGSPEQARDLALLLRAGALAAPIQIVEERTVGPSLGADNIEQGFRSVVIGFVLVLAFMALWYRGFGLVANLALGLNLVIIVAVLSMLQATLTLPGIAGIVLTVGMAVDANVLIFERIREELRNGSSPHASIVAGYDKAFSSIADANITTILAAIVLFMFGTGPIKGFAITLTIGIATSMFTAIVCTRAVVNYFVGGRRMRRLSI
ncbi:protein translocase subunit SecD [Ectothiorhodospiraceae bacterium 2226]|nr:protein translocase subunit SecD [Ectothiorhodospiraceae bacterium 2226]